LRRYRARLRQGRLSLDADEIAILVTRGKEFIANGDLAGARHVLQRAAESKDAQAALVLAATYDPVILRELKVYGLAADIAMARMWYQKAKEFGSAEAPRRLEILASGAR
jgi:TPR repeat protein